MGAICCGQLQSSEATGRANQIYRFPLYKGVCPPTSKYLKAADVLHYVLLVLFFQRILFGEEVHPTYRKR